MFLWYRLTWIVLDKGPLNGLLLLLLPVESGFLPLPEENLWRYVLQAFHSPDALPVTRGKYIQEWQLPLAAESVGQSGPHTFCAQSASNVPRFCLVIDFSFVSY